MYRDIAAHVKILMTEERRGRDKRRRVVSDEWVGGEGNGEMDDDDDGPNEEDQELDDLLGDKVADNDFLRRAAKRRTRSGSELRANGSGGGGAWVWRASPCTSPAAADAGRRGGRARSRRGQGATARWRTPPRIAHEQRRRAAVHGSGGLPHASPLPLLTLGGVVVAHARGGAEARTVARTPTHCARTAAAGSGAWSRMLEAGPKRARWHAPRRIARERRQQSAAHRSGGLPHARLLPLMTLGRGTVAHARGGAEAHTLTHCARTAAAGGSAWVWSASEAGRACPAT
ncbi:hypothetical protein K438DRAFT_1996284 [Mycena galopus ATCC 62051]|nr:hypothetical protein K438DRAFT_1996284 [Mycena galopus ATCC 62051]